MSFYEWTCDRITRLLDMRLKGFTARQIALAMGTTRGSIMGKINRLGVCRPGTQSQNGALGGRAVRKQRPPSYNYKFEKTPAALKRPTKPPREISPPMSMPPARAIGAAEALRKLRLRDCRWPIGDPHHDDFRFCGAVKAPGSSYCEHHFIASINPCYRTERDDEKH